jgi:hypothetical protein
MEGSVITLLEVYILSSGPYTALVFLVSMSTV